MNLAQRSFVLGLVVVGLQGCGASPFTAQLGAGSEDDAAGIATDPAGHVYVVGTTSGAFPGASHPGGVEALVIQLDGDGATRWTRALGTTGDDIAAEVAIDASGAVYVVGYTSGSFPGFTSAGGQDVFVAKLDGAGTTQWLRQFGTDGDDYGNTIAADTDGAIYVAGSTSGSFPGHVNAGGLDPFLVKLDADGAQQWLQQPGTSNAEQINGVATDGHGNLFLAGSTGGRDGLLMKYDREGTQQWARPASGGALIDIAVDGGGNLYVAGNLTTGIARSLSIAKLDGEGAVLWSHGMGGRIDNQSTGVSGVALDSRGNVVIAGHTDENLGGSTNAGGSDLLVAKLDGAGNFLWTQLAGTSGVQAARGVAIDGSDDIFATGYTVNGFPSPNGRDIILMKYQPDGTAN